MAYSYVGKGVSVYSASSSTTVAITYTPTAGNDLIVAATMGQNGTLSITDSLGTHETYDSIGAQFYSSNGQQCGAWYVLGCQGGSRTITVSQASAAPYRAIQVYEYSGLSTYITSNGGTQQASPGTGTGAVTPGTLSTGSSVPCAMFGICIDTSGGSWPTAVSGTGRGNDWDTTVCTLLLEDQRETSSGTYGPTFTAGTGSDTFVSFGLLLQESGTAPTLGGQSITSSEGTPSANVSYTLIGQAIASAEGTISASTGGNVTLTLGGQLISSTEGIIAPGISYLLEDGTTLSGLSVASTEGVASADISYTLGGQSIISANGSLGIASSYTVEGQAITSTEGAISLPGNVTRTLAGVFCGLSVGTITVSGYIPPGDIAMPNLIGIDYYQALLVLQNAGIYLPVPSYGFVPSSISVAWQKGPLPPGFVSGQSIAAGFAVAPGQSIILTVSSFPFSSVIDSVDWKQAN